MIYRVMAWAAFIDTLIIIVAGITFGLLYHFRTGGRWRDNELGRHLMWFVLAPTTVLTTLMVPTHQLWWLIVRLIVYTTVPLVYINQVLIFLKVQKESDESDQDH